MRNIFKILVISMLIMFFSCSQEKHKFGLKFLKNINFQVLDSTNGKYYYYMIYYDKLTNKEYFVWLNNLTNSLDFFDTDNGKFRFCKTYNQDFRIYQFYIQNLDSVFILRNRKNHIGLFNRKGDLIKNYLFDDMLRKPIPYQPVLTEESPFLYKHNKLYYFIDPIKSVDIEHYLQSPKLAIINIKKETEISVIKTLYFPAKYHETVDYNFYRPSYCLTPDEKILVSFEVCHKLYIYNKNGKLNRTINAKSKYLNKFQTVDKNYSSDLSYNNKFRIKNPRYGGIYYDEYRKLYYRVAIHKQPLFDDNEMPNHIGDNPWSIIILSKDFKKIDEIYIEGEKYYPHIFITRKGLLLLDLKKFYSKRPNNCYDLNLFKLYEKN